MSYIPIISSPHHCLIVLSICSIISGITFNSWLLFSSGVSGILTFLISKWLCLIGSINKDKPYFEIGLSNYITPEKTGELYLFANDALAFYSNNSGSIDVTIKRVK